MIEMTFKMKATFHAKAVSKAVDKQSSKAVSRSLESVRSRMLLNLKRRKGPSQPGQPPNVHTSSPTRSLRNIMLAYDEQTKSGVVGAVGLSNDSRSGIGNRGLPGFLEAGGTRQVRSKSGRRGGSRTTKRVRVAARPNAGPSLKRAIASGDVLAPWSNVVTG